MRLDDAFLRESRFCDHRHPAVQGLAEVFRSKYPDDRELAVALFYHVRDGIKYEVGGWQQTASQTLERGYGTCSNNANVLVALLRACGVPASYGVMTVRGREYFGPVAPPRLARFAAEVSKHIYAYVHLDGAWVRCDPSDDEGLSTATQHLNPQSRITDWDGYAHADLNLNPAHILTDHGPLADIDCYLARPMRRVLRLPVRIGNAYIEFLRIHGSRYQGVAEAEAGFEQWLRGESPMLARVYGLIPGQRRKRSGFSASAR